MENKKASPGKINLTAYGANFDLTPLPKMNQFTLHFYFNEMNRSSQNAPPAKIIYNIQIHNYIGIKKYNHIRIALLYKA